jgi:periplasmic protein TonB
VNRRGDWRDRGKVLYRTDPDDRSSRIREERDWRRALRVGLAAAIVLHLLLLALWRITLPDPETAAAAAGPANRDIRAAEGGTGGMQQVDVRVAQPEQPREEPAPDPVPIPEPVPVPEVRPEPREPRPDPRPPVQLAGTAVGDTRTPGTGGAGSTVGEGTTGTGAGGGGTAPAGPPAATAPVPRGMILPPSERPRTGVSSVTVLVHVNAQGRVDQVRLDPPTGDAAYDRRLARSAREWSFEPARQGGRAVAAWYPYEILF